MPMSNHLQPRFCSNEICHGSNQHATTYLRSQSSKLHEYARSTLAGVYEVYIADLLVGYSASAPSKMLPLTSIGG